MFRPIRKKRNEISIERAKRLLRTERRGVLAVSGLEEYPYAVPINFLYDEENGKIYFHSAPAGHKADALKECDRVCFTVFGNETVKDEPWAPYMQSAVVFGRCHRAQSREETTELVRKFALKYYPDAQSVEEEIEASGKAVRMYIINIEHISGKEIQER